MVGRGGGGPFGRGTRTVVTIILRLSHRSIRRSPCGTRVRHVRPIVREIRFRRIIFGSQNRATTSGRLVAVPVTEDLWDSGKTANPRTPDQVGRRVQWWPDYSSVRFALHVQHYLLRKCVLLKRISFETISRGCGKNIFFLIRRTNIINRSTISILTEHLYFYKEQTYSGFRKIVRICFIPPLPRGHIL